MNKNYYVTKRQFVSLSELKMLGLSMKDVKDWVKHYYYRPLQDIPGFGKYEVSPTFDPQLGFDEERKERGTLYHEDDDLHPTVIYTRR